MCNGHCNCGRQQPDPEREARRRESGDKLVKNMADSLRGVQLTHEQANVVREALLFSDRLAD